MRWPLRGFASLYFSRSAISTGMRALGPLDAELALVGQLEIGHLEVRHLSYLLMRIR